MTVSVFLSRLYAMFEFEMDLAIYRWNDEKSTLIIYDPMAFESIILKKVFPQLSITSFDEILRSYGFQMVSETPTSYFHPHFKIGDKASISKVC